MKVLHNYCLYPDHAVEYVVLDPDHLYTTSRLLVGSFSLRKVVWLNAVRL